jgi:hypothetical protein
MKKYNKNYWKVINGFKNVADMTYCVNCYGDVKLLYGDKLIHQKIANKKDHPYKAVNLYMKDGSKEWVLMHQLVATYFVKNT